MENVSQRLVFFYAFFTPDYFLSSDHPGLFQAATASITPHALVAEKSGGAAGKSGGAAAKMSVRKSVLGVKYQAKAADVWTVDFETVFHGGRVAVQDADRAFFALKREVQPQIIVLRRVHIQPPQVADRRL